MGTGVTRPWVRVQINGSWLQTIALFRNCDEKLYTQISLAMSSIAYCPLESVMDLHEPPSMMFIVERGIVGGRAWAPHSSTAHTVCS